MLLLQKSTFLVHFIHFKSVIYCFPYDQIVRQIRVKMIYIDYCHILYYVYELITIDHSSFPLLHFIELILDNP